METALFYQTKATALNQFAESASSPGEKARWRALAVAWFELASRTEAEDSFLRGVESAGADT